MTPNNRVFPPSDRNTAQGQRPHHNFLIIGLQPAEELDNFRVFPVLFALTSPSSVVTMQNSLYNANS